MASTWPGSRGSITDGLRPSLDQETPRMTAWISSPAASASSRRFNARRAVPPLKTTPSAPPSGGGVGSRARKPAELCEQTGGGGAGVEDAARDGEVAFAEGERAHGGA